ncbi:MAG: hypothetical protein ACFFCY_05030 [Promethearchaeota archaeon]
MIQEPFIFLLICIISIGLKKFIDSDRAGIIRPIAKRLFFIGVIFHELAHYGMSIVVGKLPRSISINWRDWRGKKNPNGSVEPKDWPSFLQSIIISLAPLYLSTWLIFYLWFGVLFTPFYDPIIKTLTVFLVISLLLTAGPSEGDLKMIGNSFMQDPKNSWYQILLISLSILILWIVLVYFQIIFFLDVFYYLGIAGLYLILKFTLIWIRRLVIRIDKYNFKNPQRVKSRRFTRKRYRPSKPWRKKE